MNGPHTTSPTTDDLTVAAHVDAWLVLRGRTVGGGTYRRDERMLRLHVLPYRLRDGRVVGDLLMEELADRSILHAVLRGLRRALGAAGYRDTTIRAVSSTVRVWVADADAVDRFVECLFAEVDRFAAEYALGRRARCREARRRAGPITRAAGPGRRRLLPARGHLHLVPGRRDDPRGSGDGRCE